MRRFVEISASFSADDDVTSIHANPALLATFVWRKFEPREREIQEVHMSGNAQQYFGRAVPVRAGDLPSSIDECHLEILRLRDEMLGMSAELAEIQHRIALSENPLRPITAYVSVAVANHLEAQVHSLEKEVELLRNSWTWRLGKAVLLPVRLLQRILGRTK